MPAPRPQPRYQQIAAELRLRVQSGLYPAGTWLPAVSALAREFSVAMETMRRALDVLRSEGLLETAQGRGTIARPVRRMVHLSSSYMSGGGWRAALAAQGMVGSQTIDAAGNADPPAEVTAALWLDDGDPVVARERTMYADGHPVQLVITYYPGWVAAGSELVDQRPVPGGTFAALRRLGFPPATASEQITARMPTAEERDRLRLPAGIPVIVHRRTTIALDGRPIEYDVTVMAADRCVLDYDDLPITSPSA